VSNIQGLVEECVPGGWPDYEITRRLYATLAHDPEKWRPVFRKITHKSKKLKHDGDSIQSHYASACDGTTVPGILTGHRVCRNA